MADGKWIADLHANTPLADAARRVLTVRLQVVQNSLPLALRDWKHDIEHVHQLRVGTRRTAAALAVFADCLPRKVCNKIRKRLRKLRRVAGEARDWDVFALSLAEREHHVTQAQRPGLDFLIGYSQAQRIAAQDALEQAGKGAPFNFERLAANTVASVREPGGNGRLRRLRDLAGPWLSSILAELHTAASDNLEQYDHLHQVRILGKRLRYGMEVFATCFDDDFKDRYYPMVEEMQDILGLANDSHVASQRLAALRDLVRGSQPALWKRLRPGVEGVLHYHQRRLPQQRRHFERWWARWQKSGADAALVGMVHAES
ncbi:MAG TPA: CHAD domain-containing protein [Gemmataceae bacterium]|nr:CHAD domain-containing protein [Gemmataceae bacterium]